MGTGSNAQPSVSSDAQTEDLPVKWHYTQIISCPTGDALQPRCTSSSFRTLKAFISRLETDFLLPQVDPSHFFAQSQQPQVLQRRKELFYKSSKVCTWHESSRMTLGAKKKEQRHMTPSLAVWACTWAVSLIFLWLLVLAWHLMRHSAVLSLWAWKERYNFTKKNGTSTLYAGRRSDLSWILGSEYMDAFAFPSPRCPRMEERKSRILQMSQGLPV